MSDKVSIVMQDGAPIVALHHKKDAFEYSRRIGGPGEGHAIGVVTIPIFTNLEQTVVEDSI